MPVTQGKLALKRSATGLGLFALRPIRAGKRLIEYVGPVITNEEADKKGGMYLFALSDTRTIDGSARSNLARYVNHACRPNAEAFSTGRRLWIWSKRDIEAGEEITINYGKTYFDQHIKPRGCKCETCVNKPKRKR
ncbi:MAG TPA: SET domain-containing protein-lysine N-methyltransferase [Pyrinomonadaceae bacterium]|nr:SET domain-containing protein-lysine N-methyltransferase [Pyrinomonadaceae bacterium]